MTLPASYYDALESEALRLAHEVIADRKPGCLFGPDSDQLYGRRAMKCFAFAHPFCMDDVVYLAECGSADADLALREIIAEKTDRSEPLGAVLGAYNIRLINPSRAPPGKTGPKSAREFLLHFKSAMLVSLLVERLGLAGFHNTASKKPTAPAIVARALEHAGIVALHPKTIEKYWRRFLPAFAGEPAAIRTRFERGIPPGLAVALYGNPPTN